MDTKLSAPGADLGGGCRGCAPLPEMTCGFLIQLVFCKKNKKTMWFIGFEVEQETSAPPPKKDPGSAPVLRWFREGLWDTYFSFRKGLVSLYDDIKISYTPFNYTTRFAWLSALRWSYEQGSIVSKTSKWQRKKKKNVTGKSQLPRELQNNFWNMFSEFFWFFMNFHISNTN